MKKLSEVLNEITQTGHRGSIEKAYGDMLLSADNINKGGNKDFGSLNTMTKQVIRNGKTYNAKFYVDSPDKTKETNMRAARETESANKKTNAAERTQVNKDAKSKEKKSEKSNFKAGSKVRFGEGNSTGKVKSIQNVGGNQMATVVDAKGKTYIVSTSKLKNE